MGNQRYCQAGKKHIWLRQDNVVQLCCSLASNVDNHRFQLKKTEDFYDLIHSDDFIKKYKLLGARPLRDGECDICKQVESAKVNPNSQRLKLEKLTDNGEKFFLKIDFSNKCNLKCTMCSSQRSTSWIKDEQKMNKIVTDPVLQLPIDGHNVLSDKWWESIPMEWWKTLGAVELSGGEPFYQPEAIDFMNFLGSHFPHISLRIITNTTLVNDTVLGVLDKFNKINLICSVDAWEDRIYRYVRGDKYGIDDVKQNIETLMRFVKSKSGKIGIVDTIHVVNYDQAPLGQSQVDEWQKLYSISYNPGHVFKPHHLNPNKVLPKKFYKNSTEDVILQNRFYEFITSLDKVRNTNILDIRPEFENWFKEIGDRK
jgi:MoaA/NifB/PqqE/SkfB family radical SAM enzyme